MTKNDMQNFISFKELLEWVAGALSIGAYALGYIANRMYNALKVELKNKADNDDLTNVKVQLENFITTHEDKHMVLDNRLEATLEKIHTKMDEGFKDVRETLNALTVAVKVTDKLLNKAD